jgi:hypothetical protein
MFAQGLDASSASANQVEYEHNKSQYEQGVDKTTADVQKQTNEPESE